MKLENYTKKTKKYSEKCQRGPNNKNDNKNKNLPTGDQSNYMKILFQGS